MQIDLNEVRRNLNITNTGNGADRPLEFANIAFDGEPVPEPEYSVPDRIPAHQACLFTGHGGTGKSIIGLQLCAAHTLGRDWLYSMPAYGPAFFIDSEDHLNVIWRRLDAIKNLYGVTYQDMINGGLHILAMAGEDTVMAVADKSGKIVGTAFYNRLVEAAADIKPVQIVIASAADVFAGNENDRSQVRQFTKMLVRIATLTGGSITLIAHPSRLGMDKDNNGGGFSGSTAWHNSFRSRIYLEGVQNDENSDLRQISFLKNQYGPTAEKITLRWRNGLFLPEPKTTDFEKAAEQARLDIALVELLHKYLDRGQKLAANMQAPNYPPTLIAKHENGFRKADMIGAMNRLLEKKIIIIVPRGPPSGRVEYVEFPEVGTPLGTPLRTNSEVHRTSTLSEPPPL